MLAAGFGFSTLMLESTSAKGDGFSMSTAARDGETKKAA